MPGINIDKSDKQTFDELKPADATQAEFFAEVMHTFQHADEPVTIDVEALTEEIKLSVASEVELSAYRGVTEAIANAND